MLFISVDDFLGKAYGATKLTRENEKSLALKMKEGDAEARQAILEGYLPLVASYVRRAPKEIQTLQTVYCCMRRLEESVDSFDFLQDSESFTHHLSLRLRRSVEKCIADHSHS